MYIYIGGVLCVDPILGKHFMLTINILKVMLYLPFLISVFCSFALLKFGTIYILKVMLYLSFLISVFWSFALLKFWLRSRYKDPILGKHFMLTINILKIMFYLHFLISIF